MKAACTVLSGGKAGNFDTVGLSACVGVVAIYIIKTLLYDILPWGLTPPQSLEWLFGLLLPLSIISTGIVIFILCLRVLSRVSKSGFSIRDTALIALVLEVSIIIFFSFNDGNFGIEIFNRALNAFSDNSLISIVFLPIILFIILDIGVSIFAGLISKTRAPSWFVEAEQRIRNIEKGLVFFVCNLIAGFVNLLLFIPDFFNHIGSILLDVDNFFPKDSLAPLVNRASVDNNENTKKKVGSKDEF